MIAFFRNLRKRLDRADAFDDTRNAFYEERLSHLADRIKELQDLHTRERKILSERIEIHDARLQALDYWTRDVGRLAGIGGNPVDLETEIISDSDPLDAENWDDEMSLVGMAMYPQPLGDDDAGES